MQEIRGPGHPVPDSVPEELVAVYGDQARHTVRYRRSWRYRQARRIGRWMGGRDPWYVSVAALLWAVIVAALAAAIVSAGMRWPRQTADAALLASVALVACFVTAHVVRRHPSSPSR
jgi:fatty acid desaturase